MSDTDGCKVNSDYVSKHSIRKSLTVREYLDSNIAQARKNLEAACIAKAKAETLQLLDYPHEDLQQIISYPF